MTITPPIISPAPSDADLNARLAREDDAALAELDAPVEEIPARAKVPDEEEDVTPPPDVPAPPEAKVEEKKEENLDSDLDEIQPKKHAHPNTHKGYEALKGIIKETRTELRAEKAARQEFEQKFTALETEYKGKVITPELEKELTELRAIRREDRPEDDPQFQKEFVAPIAEISTRALRILEVENLSPEMKDFIVKSGGVIAMCNSSRQMPAPYSGQTFREFICNTLAGKLSPVGQTRFNQAIATGMDRLDDMNHEIELAKKGGSERQQKRQQDIQEQFNKAVLDTRASLGKMGEKMDYPPNASKDDKALIDKHNARVKKGEDLVTEYIKEGKNPTKVAEALVRAAQSQILVEELQDKDADLAKKDQKIKELEEKLEKIKGSGSTGRVSSAPPPSSKPQTGKILTDAEALEAWK